MTTVAELRLEGRRLRRAAKAFALSLCLAAGVAGLSSCMSGSGGGVGSRTLTSIAVTPSRPVVATGATMQLIATGTFSDASTKDITNSAAWTSSDTTLATVESTSQTNPGLATGVAKGTPTITASLNGVSGTVTLNVTVSVTLTSVAVSPASATVSVAAATQFTATGTFSDASTKNLTSGATWTSSDTTKATIQTQGQSNPGLATGVAKGPVTITASFNGVSGTATLTVVPPNTLVSIVVEPTNPSIAIGTQEQFTATGTFSDGTVQDVTTCAAWTSSNPADATIETAPPNPGLAIGVAATGSTPVTIAAAAAAGTCGAVSATSGSTNLTVSNAPINVIIVDPDSPTIAAGTTQQFFATAQLNDGTVQDITASATWASSNTAAATIQAGGLATAGLAAGTTTVSAAFNGMTGQTSLTLTASSGNGRKTPLIDMNLSANYLSFPGGLYGGDSNTVPAAHDADGKTIAGAVQPLDMSGNPSSSGQIVFASIGMSNAADEFGVFIKNSENSSQVNHTNLVIVNGAKGGVTACDWVVANGAPPCDLSGENQFDRVRDQVLPPLGVTEKQIQIVWIKEANGGPGVHGCGSGALQPCRALCDFNVAGCTNDATDTEALRYEAQLGKILRAAKTRWPNLKLAFFSSRVFAGYATGDLNPEPYAYEYGFSTQFLMTAQINQIANGTIDLVAGNLKYDVNDSNGASPWIAWSAYIWANGDVANSEGLLWCDGQSPAPCSGEVDFQSDGTHPNAKGQEKVANLLLTFFLNSPYTKGWFAAVP